MKFGPARVLEDDWLVPRVHVVVAPLLQRENDRTQVSTGFGQVILVARWEGSEYMRRSSTPVGLGASDALTMAIIPGPARHLNGVPAARDPILDTALTPSDPPSRRWPPRPSATGSWAASSAPTASPSCALRVGRPPTRAPRLGA
jgi:hypothetical protein